MPADYGQDPSDPGLHGVDRPSSAGDGKYGKLDKRYTRKYQALYSYRLKFAFISDAGCLTPLNGREFAVERVDFAEEFFPDYQLQKKWRG